MFLPSTDVDDSKEFINFKKNVLIHGEWTY